MRSPFRLLERAPGSLGRGPRAWSPRCRDLALGDLGRGTRIEALEGERGSGPPRLVEAGPSARPPV